MFYPLAFTHKYIRVGVYVPFFIKKSFFFSVLVTSLFVSDVLIKVSYVNTLIERLVHVDLLGCE